MQLETKPPVSGIELLVQTVQDLSLARDIDSVMRIVRSVARDLTGADGATFVLRDGENCYYADEDAISPLWKGSRFPMKSCISGWVMVNKKPVVIQDIFNDERIPIDVYKPTFVKSLAMVPIRSVDPIGAIGNYWADFRIPTEQDIALLKSLADITAVSIANIELLNTLEYKVKERTKALSDSLEREKELNAMKSAFVSMASHEFRTPLSTILSSTSLAERYMENNDREKQIKHLGRIKNSVQNLTGILNDFLSVEKLELGKVEAVNEQINIKDLLEDVIDSVDGMRKPNQVVHFQHQGENTVNLDENILRNVFNNLISNAIKYSDNDVFVHSEVNNNQLEVEVRDTGIGIPIEQQEKLFGKFFRANNTGKIHGTGLGLNIVKHYIDLLNGEINFESKENEGSTFKVIVPVV